MSASVNEEKERVKLAKRVMENPYEHLTHSETRLLFRWGEKCLREILRLNPPMVANKFCPSHLDRWLWENRERIQKLDADDEA